MPDWPLSWAQTTTLFFFGGFVWWAIRWTGRNLRSQIGERRPNAQRNALSPLEVDAIVARRLATPVELFNMSAAEQRLLAETAIAMVTATQQIPTLAIDSTPPRAFCPHCGTFVENWPAQVPWRCECATCGAAIVLRRDGQRVVLSYTPRG